MTRKKIAILASLPGPAEAFIPVIKGLQSDFDCSIIGLAQNNPLYQGAGGSWEVWQGSFPQTANLAEIFQSPEQYGQWLKQTRPALLLLGAVPDLEGKRDFPEKYFLQVAKLLDIKTAQFVDAWSSWSASSHLPDAFLVIDEVSQQIGRRLYPQHQDIFVSGHPGLQSFYQDYAAIERHPFKPVRACYFTQPNVDTRKALTWLSQALQPEDSLYIKKHPRDDSDYQDCYHRFHCNLVLTSEPPERLYSLINRSITHTSVVGLKSAILSIPTINILPKEATGVIYNLAGGYPLAVAGLSVEVNSQEELKEAIENPPLVDGKILCRHFHLEDACERFISKIERMVEQPKGAAR